MDISFFGDTLYKSRVSNVPNGKLIILDVPQFRHIAVVSVAHGLARCHKGVQFSVFPSVCKASHLQLYQPEETQDFCRSRL